MKAKYKYDRSSLADRVAGYVSDLDELHSESVDGIVDRNDLERRIQDMIDNLQDLSDDLTKTK